MTWFPSVLAALYLDYLGRSRSFGPSWSDGWIWSWLVPSLGIWTLIRGSAFQIACLRTPKNRWKISRSGPCCCIGLGPVLEIPLSTATFLDRQSHRDFLSGHGTEKWISYTSPDLGALEVKGTHEKNTTFSIHKEGGALANDLFSW